MPRLYRDAQVGTIWEGTTNILSLDLLRVLKGSPEVLKYFEDVRIQLDSAPRDSPDIIIFHQAISSRLEKGRGVKGIEQQIKEIQEAVAVVKKYLHESAE